MRVCIMEVIKQPPPPHPPTLIQQDTSLNHSTSICQYLFSTRSISFQMATFEIYYVHLNVLESETDNVKLLTNGVISWEITYFR
jgi:hypothetical protein